MRPELNTIERIEQYLTGQLNPADRAAFEAELAADPNLREALRLQQDLRKGLQRITRLHAIQKAKRHYYQTTWLKRGGLGLGLSVVVCIATLLLTAHGRRFAIVPGLPAATHGETYTIDLRRDTLLQTAHGALINITRGSIEAGGAGSVRLEIKEAYSIADMLRYGLITQSNGRPLSSGGMIDIQPVEGSHARIVRPINVALPTLRVEENMQRFRGVIDDKGKINWTDPRPLSDSVAQNQIVYGRSLFLNNCSSCHSMRSTVTGPGLAYIGQRRSEGWLYDFIRSNNKLLVSGDCYANYLFNIYNKTPMNLFPNLNHTDIRYLLAYISSESQLIDSNQVPNYTREFDSCRQYKRLAGALEKNREALIGANGQRTTVVRRNDTGAIITDTAIITTTPAPVTTPLA